LLHLLPLEILLYLGAVDDGALFRESHVLFGELEDIFHVIRALYLRLLGGLGVQGFGQLGVALVIRRCQLGSVAVGGLRLALISARILGMRTGLVTGHLKHCDRLSAEHDVALTRLHACFIVTIVSSTL